jgi:hypothetical protein
LLGRVALSLNRLAGQSPTRRTRPLPHGKKILRRCARFADLQLQDVALFGAPSHNRHADVTDLPSNISGTVE